MKKNLLSMLLLLFGMAAMAQLQNSSFEQWENPVDDPTLPNRPTGWIRSNGVPGSENFGFYQDPATDSQDGSHALKLSIWYTYDKDMAYQVAPISSRPAALTGYYKYTQNVIDNPISDDPTDLASATVYLTKWNDALQQTDTIGSGQLFLSTSEDYSFFSCPIVYTSNETPDTVKVILDCTLMRKGEEANGITTIYLGGVGSIFTVDNIALTDNLATSIVEKETPVIYPNPAVDKLFIRGFEGEAFIYDVSGKLLRKVSHDKASGIDIVNLQTGVYFVTISNEAGSYKTKFLKQ